MATHLQQVERAHDPLDDLSLPGWLYCDPEFFEAEKKAFLRAAPQVVCHESEIAEPGEWRSLEYLGESVILMRGDDRSNVVVQPDDHVYVGETRRSALAKYLPPWEWWR